MSSTNVGVMLQFWKNFDLSQFQSELDQTATEVASKQDASDVSRRKLVEQVKLFKRNSSDEVKKAVSILLKSFQGEIDALTKRSKSSESEFLNLYKKVIELPDPTLALEQAEFFQKKNQRLNDIEIENSKLRETLAEYNKEFAEVKNQEVTIKSLKEKIKELERDSASNAQKIIEEKERVLIQNFTEKEKIILDNQYQAATKLSELEKKEQNLQIALESSQSEVFNLKEKFDEENEARLAEIEILVCDLDRANLANETSRKEIESLKDEMKLLQENFNQSNQKEVDLEASIGVISQSNLENELNSKEREVQQLVEHVQHFQNQLLRLRETTTSQITQLEEEVDSANQKCEEYKAELSQKIDYNEIKRELSIIKSTQFSTISDEKNKSLEVLLLEKNRLLQDENTSLRNANIQSQEAFKVLQEELEVSKDNQSESASLIKRLEEDLLSIQSPSSVFRSAADGSSASRSNVSHEVIVGALKDSSIAPDVTDVATKDSSLLLVVTSQRERFRQQNNELQSENYQLHQNVQQLHNDLEMLRADNIKLFEKIKYLQSYSSPTSVTINEDVTSKRYSSQYEDNLDPFTSFSRKEKQRRYMNLSPPEKVTLGVSRMILTSKIGRTIFFFYMLFMHFLLYVVLYKYAYVDDCKHHIADLCYERFGAQMVPDQ